jgi:hypothetical protein
MDDAVLTQDQIDLTELDNMYRAKLCINRNHGWHETYDAMGKFIPESERKPYFEGGLPKRIVDVFTSEVFGFDKFPRVHLKVKPTLYATTVATGDTDVLSRFITNDNVSLVDQNGDDKVSPEEARHHLIANSKRLAEEVIQAIISQAFLAATMLKAARKAYVMGKSLLVFKVSDGEYFTEVKDPRWIKNLKYHPHNPNKILSFTEEYVYMDIDPQDGQEKRYLYRCDYNETGEYKYIPVEFKGWKEKHRAVIDNENSFVHNFGFCPAVACRCDDDASILEDQKDNLLSYMYLGSDAYRGVKTNMDPQWAVLTDEPNQDVKPRVRGNIWSFHAKSVQAITPNVGGYTEARLLRRELRQEILEACRIQDVPYSNEQSAEAIRIRMKPQGDAVGEYRILFGDKALRQLLTLMFKAAVILKRDGYQLKIETESDVLIPDDENAFQIILAWGQIETVTIDMMYQAVQMVVLAIEKGVMTEDSGIDLLVQFMPVHDADQMKRELSKRRQEKKNEDRDLIIMDVIERVLALIDQREQVNIALKNQALAERQQAHNEETQERQMATDEMGETIPPEDNQGEE